MNFFRHDLLKKPVILAAILIPAWLISVALAIWTFPETGQAPAADCAIVMGAAVYGEKPKGVLRDHALPPFFPRILSNKTAGLL